ncbi:MAG: hypothetical protein HQL51_10120 [Magnetococcales bacterium]|nr:hypothetical protein [Magnetococcales bacterium]
MLTMNNLNGFGAARSSGGFAVKGIATGTGMYVNRALSGLSAGVNFTLSYWFRITSDPSDDVHFWQTTGGNFLYGTFSYGGSMPLTPSIILDGNGVNNSSSADVASGTTWHHMYVSCNGSTGKMYLDGASVATLTPNGSNIRYDNVSGLHVGSQRLGGASPPGDIAEFYLNIASYLDPATNLTKFRSASGKPVDLGANGSTPSGSQPLVYLSVRPGGVANDWASNLGSAGAFSITGTLSLSSTNPSD